jgi:hypothetical protein
LQYFKVYCQRTYYHGHKQILAVSDDVDYSMIAPEEAVGRVRSA